MSETIYTAANPGEFAEKKEKHIPVATVEGDSIRVKVGVETHPMEATHYIEWIGIFRSGVEIARKDLQPGDAPEAIFTGITDFTNLTAREKCNLHGLWESVILV